MSENLIEKLRRAEAGERLYVDAQDRISAARRALTGGSDD